MVMLRFDGLKATLSAALSDVATSVTFEGPLTYGNGQAVPTIGSPDRLSLSLLNPAGGLAEIVHVTAYTSGSSTASISRAEESTTTAVSHAVDARAVHGPTVDVFDQIDAALAAAGGVGKFRGVWSGMELVGAISWPNIGGATYIASESKASGDSNTVVDIATTSATGRPAGLVGALRIYRSTGNNDNQPYENRVTFDVSAYEGVTRVEVDQQRTSSNLTYAIYDENGVMFHQPSGVSTWGTLVFDPAGANNLNFRIKPAISGNPASPWYLGEIRLYRPQANPYMIGEYVLSGGLLWRSTADNNEGVPGTTGWVQVSIQDAATLARLDALESPPQVYFRVEKYPTFDIPGNTFLPVPHDTVIANAGGGTWDFNTSSWTVPVTGLYLVTMLIRPVDEFGNQPRNMGQDVGVATVDSATFAWGQVRVTGGIDRLTSVYTRVVELAAGSAVKHYMYQDSADGGASAVLTMSSASWSMTLLSAT